MQVERGHIVLAAGPEASTGKTCLFVVVQSDNFNDLHASVSLCPITSVVGGDHLFRVPLGAGTETGLDRETEIQIDKVQSLRRQRLTRVIGTVPATSMTQVDDALRRWLAL